MNNEKIIKTIKIKIEENQSKLKFEILKKSFTETSKHFHSINKIYIDKNILINNEILELIYLNKIYKKIVKKIINSKNTTDRTDFIKYLIKIWKTKIKLIYVYIKEIKKTRTIVEQILLLQNRWLKFHDINFAKKSLINY